MLDMTLVDLEDAFDWLDAERANGGQNMFGVAPDLADYLNRDKKLARQVLRSWMETFSDESSTIRAQKALSN